jgi:CelD/BcsL family acetyltransferase involved in cellulose biosynthesis
MVAITSPERPSSLALDRPASAIASARRAVVADRYAASSLEVEWRNFPDLRSITAEWRALAARALEPNVFYEPEFALEAAGVFSPDVGAVLVWSGTTPRELLGFFPALIETRRYVVGPAVLSGWTHSYAPLGTPLVEREAAEPVIAAWLAHLADNRALPGLLLLPYLAAEGPFAAVLDAILTRAQMPVADFNFHRRAQLVPGDDRLLYVEHTLAQHKHKELRRGVRRLSDLSAILFTTATEPETVAGAVEDFLELESRGWKGKAGTAALYHDDVRGFIKTMATSLAADGKAAVHRMLIDGRAVAVAITLRSADTAWLWKITYDENYAQYSPGVILAVAVTEELIDDATIVRTDSCATSEHPMIDHIWRERSAFCDRLIAVRPQAPFLLARRLEALRGAAIGAAKTIRERFHR